MGKKSSSKKAKVAAVPENSGVGEEGPNSSRKKSGNEIDEIFAGKKRKKPENGVEDGGVKKNKKKNKDKDMRRMVKEKGSVEAPSRPRKKTGDGLTIYTEEELGIGNANAGGTPLCPFDCECCF